MFTKYKMTQYVHEFMFHTKMSKNPQKTLDRKKSC